MMILYLRERLRGTPEDTIWAVHYQKRFWQAVIHGGHSIPLTALGAVLAWLCQSDALLAFFASALFHALGDLPQSRLRAAITYMQNLWPGLLRFVSDGRLPLDNNPMERDLRGVVIGWENHYGSRSERGTQVAALLYSLVETARHHGIPEHLYRCNAAKHALRNLGASLLSHQLA